MAQRRMFSQKVTETDRFLDMSPSAQNLYFHLGMNADDDGFVGNPKSIKRMIGASDDDLKSLVEKDYIIVFDDGVIVIKDWLVSNYIKKDRYTPTVYTDDKKLLGLGDNKRYQFLSELKKANRKQIQDGTEMEPERNQNGTKVDPQVRLGKSKYRLGKDSLSKTTSSSAETELKDLHIHLNEKQQQILTDYIDDLSLEVVDFAIDSMAQYAEKPTFNYLCFILSRYQQYGIRTLKQAQEDDDAYHGRNSQAKVGLQIPIYKLGE